MTVYDWRSPGYALCWRCPDVYTTVYGKKKPEKPEPTIAARAVYLEGGCSYVTTFQRP